MINAYAEREPQDAKSPVAIFGAPGVTQFATCGTGPVRGMEFMNGVLYVVSGTTLYSVDEDGTATALGGAVTGSKIVCMTNNGTQILILNGDFGYIYSEANGFQIITSSNFHASSQGTFFDTYFVMAWDGTNKWFISGSLDGTSYSGTDFASAEVSPDWVLAVVNQQENLLIFGQTTIETWYDAGSVNFPFQRIDGGTVERGCAAALTPIKEDNSVFFLGNDLIFYRLDGVLPKRISTHAIEDAWQKYDVVSDAYCFSYTFNGHKFITLTFPSANATWVYDISTGLWHERISWNEYNVSYGRWRVSTAKQAYGRTVVGDAYSGSVGYLDGTVATEFGNQFRVEMVTPIIHDDRKRVFVSRFELDVEQGMGATTGQGADPLIMLSWSDDGGRVFNSPQLFHSIGKLGEYRARVFWRRLGQTRNRVWKVSISDPVPRVIISAHADLAVGM
jgi:hypothetical protein